MNDKIQFEHITVSKIEGFSIIEVNDVIGLVKFAEANKVRFIFKIESKNPVFFFSINNTIYKIKSNDYRSLEDFYYGEKNGFPDAAKYYEAIETGYETYNEYEQVRKIGIDKKDDFLQAQKTGFVKGFIRFKEKYETYKMNKYTNNIPDDLDNAVKLMNFAATKGITTYKDFENIYDNGYPDPLIFNEALSKGFKNADDFYSALKMGFSEASEYTESKNLVIGSKKEYDDYIRIKMANVNKYAFDEFQLIELLKEKENGEKISLKNVRKMLEEKQQRYKRVFSNGEIKMLPLWYSKHIETKEELEQFLLNNNDIRKIGFFNKDTNCFEVMRISSKKVYIDASNAAFGEPGNNDTIPQFANVRLVIDKVKETGFSDVTVIADATLKHIAKDHGVLAKIKNDVNYYEVPSHTQADEFLIKNAKEDNCIIISNDTFSDWKKKDKWIARNIDYIRIPFMITKGRVTLSGIEDVLQDDR